MREGRYVEKNLCIKHKLTQKQNPMGNKFQILEFLQLSS